MTEHPYPGTHVKPELDAIRRRVYEDIEALTGDEIACMVVRLAVMLGNLSETNAKQERAYHGKWVAARVSLKTDGRTDHVAKDSEEYYRRRLSELELEAVTELINALKKRMIILGMEERSSGSL